MSLGLRIRGCDMMYGLSDDFSYVLEFFIWFLGMLDLKKKW